MDKASGLTPLYMQLHETTAIKSRPGNSRPVRRRLSENDEDEYAVTRRLLAMPLKRW